MADYSLGQVGTEYARVHAFLEDLDTRQRLGIPITLGSFARIVEDALPNWSIQLPDSPASPEETAISPRRALRELAEASYLNEWGDGCPNPPTEWIDAIKEASKACKLGHVDERLNLYIGAYATAVLLTWESQSPRPEYTILDVGCGDGRTSNPLISHLHLVGLHTKLQLLISDVSTDCRQKAEKFLEDFFAGRRHKLVALGGLEKDVLARLEPESVDIVISNAVFHHFTDEAYIDRLQRVLRPGGFVVAGDYHTTIWHHPATVAWFLEQLGAERRVLEDFRAFFPRAQSLDAINANLTPEEIRANEHMVGFWRALSARIMHQRLSPSPVLEAHESSRQRMKKFRRHGFETDIRKIIRGFHPKLRAGDDKEVTFRTSPLWVVRNTKGRVHLPSDIARVVVAQKPMKVTG